MRIVDDVLHRIKAKKTIDPLKLSRSKFPDNMEFAQWLFQHFLQMKDTVKGRYPAYAKRLEAYKKQRKIPPERTNFDLQMSSHLIPNEPLVVLLTYLFRFLRAVTPFSRMRQGPAF